MNYSDLGLVPIVNASGSVTRLGGAPLPHEVLAAIVEAAGACVPLEALQAAASRQIAAATGADAGLVTTGAAAALTLGAAAILTGLDPRRMERLPHCDGFPHELVVAREHRQGYDHAVRAAGAKLVEVGFNEIVANAGVRRTEAWEYAAAFGPQTAGVLYVFASDSRPPLAEVVAVAHARGLPVLVDAAGELPPRSNLREIIAAGADLVAFSGGKAIRGPQATGILCGRRDLVASAALQMLDMDDHPELWSPPADFINAKALAGMPRHGIGRGFKVGKEQIVGLLTALKLFTSGAYDADAAIKRTLLERISQRLTTGGLTCNLVENLSAPSQAIPTLEVGVGSRVSALEVCRALRAGQPPIYVGHGKLACGLLVIHPLHLTEETADVLTERIIDAVRRERRGSPT